MAWYDAVSLNTNEELKGIGRDRQTYSITGPNLVGDGTYFCFIKCSAANRACAIARDYFLRYLWQNQFPGVAYDADELWKLNSIPVHFSASCADTMNAGVFWTVQVRLIEYAQAMNDPTFDGFLNGSATGSTAQTDVDIAGMPNILQYRYPVDHVRRPSELLTSLVPVQADVSMISIRLPLIRYVRYPISALGLVNHVNSELFFGFNARYWKINNIGMRGLYTPSGRTGDDLHKHYFAYEVELLLSYAGHDKPIEIIDPETGRPPGDLPATGVIQDGCTYPGKRLIAVNPEIDFNLLWPQFGGLDFASMVATDFPELSGT